MPAIVPPTHREERPLCALHRGLLTDHTARICKLSESRGAAAKDSHPQKQRFCLAHRGGAAPHGKHRACRRWEGTWNPQQRMGLRTPQQRRGLRNNGGDSAATDTPRLITHMLEIQWLRIRRRRWCKGRIINYDGTDDDDEWRRLIN